jgi:undecaprenyl-diphosphatase
VGRFWDAVLLGLVQGLTEFLPVSSSGHLAIFEKILGWHDPSENFAFNIAVHVGSLAAVVIFVRREIREMLTTRPRLILLLVVATLPAVVAGLAGATKLVERASGSMLVVGICLCGTAAILAVARRIPEGARTEPELSYGRALLIGLAQVAAILPGVSRSGSTLTTGLAVGLKREDAVRFAFLMAGPAIAGAAALTAYKEYAEAGTIWSRDLPHDALAAGTLVSFVTSLLAMKLMVGVVVRRRLGWFAIYCAAVGLAAMGFALAP